MQKLLFSVVKKKDGKNHPFRFILYGVNSVLCVGIFVELVLLLLSPIEELDSNLLEECSH